MAMFTVDTTDFRKFLLQNSKYFQIITFGQFVRVTTNISYTKGLNRELSFLFYYCYSFVQLGPQQEVGGNTQITSSNIRNSERTYTNRILSLNDT